MLQERHDLDPLAARNLLAYLEEERGVTGTLPTDRTIVLQRFRDELGDWRVCLLSPFGARVHAPWALAIEARLRERLGVEVQPIWSDDGIVVRLPSAEESIGWSDGRGDRRRPPAGRRATEAAEAAVLIASDEVEELVVGAVGSSALFASRFRENAARALLLPRRRPGSRTPLWQMRQRSAQLLAVASAATARSRSSSRPTASASRTCSTCPRCGSVLAAIERREVRVVSVETQRASPFASSLLFDYIAAYMYEGDAPLVDRRAQALALDRDLLRELLGAEELRELLDADALGELELELQALTLERAAGSADQVHDLLRGLGDLSTEEVADRVRGVDAASRGRAAGEWLGALAADRRAVEVRIAGEPRWIATEDAGALPGRRGRGAAPGSAGCVPGTDPRRARWPAVAVRPAPRSVPAGRARGALGPAAGRGRDRAGAPDGGRACWSGVSSGPVAWNGSGATRRSSGCSGDGRWQGCAGRSSRSSRGRSDASCRHGRGSGSSLGGRRPVARGHRPAGGPGAAGERPGARHPAGTCRTLQRADAGRAARGGGGGLGRRRARSAATTAGSALACGPARRLSWAVAGGAARHRPGGARDRADGGWLRAAILRQLAERGASFYREILAAVLRAAGRPRARVSRPSASCWTRCGTWSGPAS